MAILLALPAILTKDIYFRSDSLCWLTRSAPLHNIHTFIAYYGIPTTYMVVIYIYVYYRGRKSSATAALRRLGNNRQQNRDVQIF